MLLNNGYDIDVVGNVQFDNTHQLICKLKHPTYVAGILVKYIVLPQQEFKEFMEKISKESTEIVVVEPEHTTSEVICDSSEEVQNNELDGREVS